MGCQNLAHIEEKETVLKCVWKSDEHEKTHVRVYDFGWRQLDVQLGVWHCVDPEAESFYSLSPYNYVNNNPINIIDPDGRSFLHEDFMNKHNAYRHFEGSGGIVTEYGTVWQRLNDTRWATVDQMINYAWDNTIGSRTFYFGGNNWNVSKSFDTGSVKHTKNLLFEGSQRPTSTGQFFGKLLAGLLGGLYSYSSYSGYGFYNITYSIGNSLSPSLSRGVLVQEQVGFDIDKALNSLYSELHPPYGQGHCSTHMHRALIAGGIEGLKNLPYYAANKYDEILKGLGFVEEVDLENYTYQRGDIAVIQGYSGGTFCPGCNCVCGHIQIFDGEHWVSDFIQPRPFWPGPDYAKYEPGYIILRWEGN